MTIRRLSSAILAALLLAAPVAANAATKHKPAMRNHAAVHHVRSTKAMKAAPRDGGSAAVEALNQQSLAAARGGATR